MAEQKQQPKQLQMELKEDCFLFTSESVGAGHPDKLCDLISDSVLDAVLAQDKNSKCGCETAVKNNICMVFGEISTKAQVSYEQIVRQCIKEVGYDDIAKGMDYKTATIISAVDTQSPDIFQCVIKTSEVSLDDIGAGDQGLMIGYATDESPEYMPLSHILANKLQLQLNKCYKEGILKWAQPDSKCQVTVEYKYVQKQLIPQRVHTILISAQHKADATLDDIQIGLREEVIKKVIPSQYLDEKTLYFLNPSGKFIIGGPTGDAGLTGRKIIVDTYGGWGGHGGGAFSGKDPTKVDRSGAYAARWVAKSLVANKFCKRAMVQIAYGIGVAEPISLHVDTYGSCVEGFTDHMLAKIILNNFDLRPGYIIKELDLKRPIFKKTACYGHFGRDDPDFLWEKVKDLSHEWKNKKQ